MKILKGAVLILALCLPGTIREAKAMTNGCPDYEPPIIEMKMGKGGIILQNQAKTAFQIAREKAVKYDKKMPIQLGNIGEGKVEATISIKVQSDRSAGCVAVSEINIDVILNHYIEIAKEFPPGSCMQNELYNLEAELRLQDVDIFHERIKDFRQNVRKRLGENYVYGPVQGLNYQKVVDDKRQEVLDIVQGLVDEINKEMFDIREETDLNEYFDEIKSDCNFTGIVTEQKQKSFREIKELHSK